MTVLGIYDGHNAGAALIDNSGVVLAAVEEERFSRIKNHDARPGHDGPPDASVAYCASMATGPIKHVALGIQEPRELQVIAGGNFERSLSSGQRQRLNRAAELGLTEEALRLLPLRTQLDRVRTLRAVMLRAGIIPEVPVSFVDHHTCHADGAFLLSRQREALVITLDGKGDDLSGTVSVGCDRSLERLFSLPTEDSVGHLYSAFTVACGLRPQRDEGKLQAMASSGTVNSRIWDWLEAHFPWNDESGTFAGTLNEGLVVGPYPDRRPEQHNELIKRVIAGVEPEDAAATVQTFLERLVCRLVRAQVARTGQHTLVVAGGVFANVSLNQRIAELPEVEQLEVHPAMTDAGIALGAAATVFARTGAPLAPLESVGLGPCYADERVAAAFSDRGFRIERGSGVAEDVLAEELGRGNVVARFVGRAEYGPRALGGRSVLAPATDPSMPGTLNRMLRRSTIMPFAPMARRRDASRWFDADPALRMPLSFMTSAVSVAAETRERYPAIVHSDGTARPQLVDPGPLEDLLDGLERRCGASVIINTSFNLHDEPMVCTPEDAARSASVAGIRVVQIGRLIARSE